MTAISEESEMKSPLILTMFLSLAIVGCDSDRPDTVIEPESSAARMVTPGPDTSTTVIENDALSSMDDTMLVGKEVVSAAEGTIGDVDSVVRDPIDQRRMVVIALSSEAGNDSKEVAVPIERLRVSGSDNQNLETDLSLAQLQAMPDYDASE
jgi:hypothetical protein